jgi:hypothetical protein
MTLHFDGDTYEPARDEARLSGQYKRVFDHMKGGGWWTLARIGEITGDTTASVSARLRDMRKERFGGHTVERCYTGDGVWIYRLVVNRKAA